jgi:hypothetical protein
MEKQFYTLKEALEVFKNKDERGFYAPFDIAFRTFNENTKQGGRLIKYKAVKYLPEANKKEGNDFKVSVKPPNHYTNRTRNIELSTGEIKSVKIDFIISVNNKKVIY